MFWFVSSNAGNHLCFRLYTFIAESAWLPVWYPPARSVILYMWPSITKWVVCHLSKFSAADQNGEGIWKLTLTATPTFHSPQHSLKWPDLYDLRTIKIKISSAFHRYQNLKILEMVTCDSFCGGGSHIIRVELSGLECKKNRSYISLFHNAHYADGFAGIVWQRKHVELIPLYTPSRSLRSSSQSRLSTPGVVFTEHFIRG